MKTNDQVDRAFNRKFQYKNVGYQPEGYSVLIDREDGFPVSSIIIKNFILPLRLSDRNTLIEEIVAKLREVYEPMPGTTIDDVVQLIESMKGK